MSEIDMAPLDASLLVRAARGRVLGAEADDQSYERYIDAMTRLAERGFMRRLLPRETTGGKVEFEITDAGRAYVARRADAMPAARNLHRRAARTPTDRNFRIADAAAKEPIERVAKRYGVTRQRVDQIVEQVADWRALHGTGSDKPRQGED